MPLFECEKCHCVDNTAVTNFWVKAHLEDGAQLCSACDPEIGKWHGRFAKRHISEFDAGQVQYPALRERAKDIE